MTQPEGFSKILDTFARHRVEFVLIGGGAGLLHGSSHSTRDVDFLIRNQLDNRLFASNALHELGAHHPGGGTVDQDDLRNINTIWPTRYASVDILISATGPEGTTLTYADIAPHADQVPGPNGGAPILVANLNDLIMTKRAAVRPKAHEALPELEALLTKTTAPPPDHSLPTPRQWPTGHTPQQPSGPGL